MISQDYGKDEIKEYRDWLVREVMKDEIYTVLEAFERATKFIDSPRFQESHARWKKLQLDVILAANPMEHIKFPNV